MSAETNCHGHIVIPHAPCTTHGGEGAGVGNEDVEPEDRLSLRKGDGAAYFLPS